MWNLVAVKQIVRKRIVRRAARTLESVAVKRWVIAPGETVTTPPAYYLPNQLERVTGWPFTFEHPRREMDGGIVVEHAPTRGYLLENAWLIDGTLYCNQACSHLQSRSSRWPRIKVQREIDRGAVYCTPGGNQYFGQWLMDDCVTYPMASAEGLPITTAQPVGSHTLDYEDWLGMKPERVASAMIREAVIFDDVGQNRHKHARFRGLRERLIARVEAKPHPGVFIVRGGAGQRRLLRNEMELAEHLRDRRGFRILEPLSADVPTIVAACAGARVVVGVEGSALMHGVLPMAAAGALLVLQPPNRFVPFYKHLTDRDQQRFGFVVGIAEDGDFRIDLAEVERTLDLFDSE